MPSLDADGRDQSRDVGLPYPPRWRDDRLGTCSWAGRGIVAVVSGGVPPRPRGLLMRSASRGEVDSTFYHRPSPRPPRSGRREARRLVFHSGERREDRHRAERDERRRLREALAPLEQAGKLGGLLQYRAVVKSRSPRRARGAGPCRAARADGEFRHRRGPRREADSSVPGAARARIRLLDSPRTRAATCCRGSLQRRIVSRTSASTVATGGRGT